MLFVIEREFVLDLFILLAGILGEPFVTSAISGRVMFVGFFARVWLLGMIFALVSLLLRRVDRFRHARSTLRSRHAAADHRASRGTHRTTDRSADRRAGYAAASRANTCPNRMRSWFATDWIWIFLGIVCRVFLHGAAPLLFRDWRRQRTSCDAPLRGAKRPSLTK
jgi:hypothetical protein